MICENCSNETNIQIRGKCPNCAELTPELLGLTVTDENVNAGMAITWAS